MGESEQKPFVCPIVGCDMSFINEDHLTVHKKKHEMMLNLGLNNKNNLFVDQTPTPTRFIRNCDEVGLFQDLPNDNPFEETFRQAVESGKIDLHTTSVGRNSDDSLHTPKVFPHITEELSAVESLKSPKSQKKQSITDKKALKTSTIKSYDPGVCASSKTELGNTDSAGDPAAIDIKKDTNIELTDESHDDKSSTKLENEVPTEGTGIQVLVKTQNGKTSNLVTAAGRKIENQVVLVKKEPSDVAISDCNFVKPHSAVMFNQNLHPAKVKLREALIKIGPMQSDTKMSQNVEKEQHKISKFKVKSKPGSHNKTDKKQDILERNRASSMRARAKRKAWIEQLQQSLRAANDMNASLQSQLKNLHTQVAKLKTLLLAHKDCPITQAMEKGNGVIVGSRVMTINPDETKPAQPVQNRPKSTKRPCREMPIAPKKRPLILTSVRNPIILPNANSSVNAITLHSAESLQPPSTVSIMAPILANAGNSRTFLGLASANLVKVPVIPRAFVIQGKLNENAASKTTGT